MTEAVKAKPPRRILFRDNYGIRAGITNATKRPSACRVFRPGPDNTMQEVFQQQLEFEKLTTRLVEAEALAKSAAAEPTP